MSPRTVLIVDDERDIEPLFRSRFRKEIREGVVDFYFAFNGEDALDRVRSDQDEIVLIFSDVSMPGISGLELLRQIRSLPCELPVYMITAYGRKTEQEALASGATGFLTKPLDLHALRDILMPG